MQYASAAAAAATAVCCRSTHTPAIDAAGCQSALSAAPLPAQTARSCMQPLPFKRSTLEMSLFLIANSSEHDAIYKSIRGS